VIGLQIAFYTRSVRNARQGHGATEGGPMRVQQSFKIVTAISALALCAACASSNPYPDQRDGSYSVSRGEWDSRPLDQDYRRERARMEQYYDQELRNAGNTEYVDRLKQERAADRRDLEDRYRRGKESRMRRLPDSRYRRSDQGSYRQDDTRRHESDRDRDHDPNNP
jgi:hypothetical protein